MREVMLINWLVGQKLTTTKIAQLCAESLCVCDKDLLDYTVNNMEDSLSYSSSCLPGSDENVVQFSRVEGKTRVYTLRI